MDLTALLKSRTIWGTVLLVLAYLTDPTQITQLAFLPSWLHNALTVVGMILTAVGVRSAIHKSSVRLPEDGGA
jgi:mannose/fructose/N-acetylgalactosamine-specific phosphotransferase system component IIC